MSVKNKETFAKETDLYEILGLAQDASQEDIKKSYNELVLLYHPDKGGDAKKFKDLQIAYKILSNEKSRELYTKSLSATFEEIANKYRDSATGKHQALNYEESANDFTKGSPEEKNKKKESFMQDFDAQRGQKEKELMESMQKTLDQKPLTYEQLLKQRDSELSVPVIDCLVTEKFDVNLFNQIFEKNKQSQTRELEPYAEILEQHRTDLASIDDCGIFGVGHDQELENHGFQTYQTHTVVDVNNFDRSHDITRTRDVVYEDPLSLYKKLQAERDAFDISIHKEPPPTTCDDNHPLSYQQLGISHTNKKN